MSHAPGTVAVAVVVLFALVMVGCQGATPSAPTGEIVGSTTWAADERLTYALYTGAGDLVGHGTLETRVEGDRLVLVQRYEAAETPAGATPATDTITVTVERATFQPVEGARVVVRSGADGGVAEERYTWSFTRGDDGAFSMVASHTRSGSTDERTVRLRDHAYDNESSLWLWRTLAFQEGFNRNYVSANAVDQNQQTVNLHVPQRETVRVPAGEFEAWRLIFRSGRAVRTAWVNVEPPHQVLRWDNSDLVFELTAIERPE